MDNLPAHSPVGASAAPRFLVCPGSVTLSEGVDDPESDYSATGTAAHEFGARALKADMGAWEFIGKKAENGIECNKPMADAVQIYVDSVNRFHARDRWIDNDFGIESRFHCPSIHKLFFGTSDFWFLDRAARTLHVWDYKNGAGVVVEVDWNEQLMYYGCGILEKHDLWQKVERVALHVAQPNGFHFKGPVRHWTIATAELETWLMGELIPGMERALVSRKTKTGDHCRFCPASARQCPALMAEMDELEELMDTIQKTPVPELTNAQLRRFKDLMDRAKIVAKKADTTMFSRLMAGQQIDGYKLVDKQVHRVWKEGAEAEALELFGQQAMEPASLKTPAQIEALPKGDEFAARWAMKPKAGLTIGKADDSRPGVNRDVKTMFKPVSKKGK